MKVTVDYGHTLSGEDTGASGCGYREENLTREIGSLVVQKLRNCGHEVYPIQVDYANSVRESLNSRVYKVNSIMPDLSISIHLNAFNGSANGSEILTDGYNSDIANRILTNFNILGMYNRGIKSGSELALVSSVKSKAMLIECCFIDNANDMSKYNADEFAEAIVCGILGLDFNQRPSANKPSQSQALIKDFMLDSTGQYGRVNTLEVSSDVSNVEFKFTVKNNSDGRTIVIKDYSTNRKVTYTPSYRGTHIFTVYARKGSQEESKEIVREIVSKCTVKDFNISESDEVGQVLKLNASATESPFAMFKFIGVNRIDNKWFTIQDYSEKATCEYELKSKGLHRFVVHVKHVNSDTEDQDDYKYVDIEVVDNHCNHEHEIVELKKENAELKDKIEKAKSELS